MPVLGRNPVGEETMSQKRVIKPVALAVGAALASTFAIGSIANADSIDSSPFEMSTLVAGYMLGEGEGSCGGDKGDMKKGEGSCGGDKGDKGDMKDGEGSCGGDKKDMKDMKDGEGSCGGDKKDEMKDGEGSCGGDKKDMKDMKDAERRRRQMW